MRRYTILSAAAVIVAIGMIFLSRASVDRDSTVVVLCAPSLAGPMEELKQLFHQSGGSVDKTHIENTYRGSAELLAMYKISQIGDMLVAADVDYHDDFVAAGFCDATQPLAKQFPCLIFTHVSENDALSVLGDTASQVTTSVPKPKHAAIGRRVASILGDQQYQLLADRAKVSRETVSQVATDVSNGIVDVGIAWSTTPNQFRNLNHVVPPGWRERSSEIGSSVFANSPKRTAAKRYQIFLGSPEARKVFAKHGFTLPAQGDTE